MKIVTVVVLVAVILVGCAKGDGDLNPAMELRQRLANGDGCTFRAEVCADYGDRVYTFVMDCKADTAGDVHFKLVSPDTISGISGTVTQSGGKLEFDDQVLLFEPLTQGELTPVIAPWLLYKVITGGYIRSVSEEADQFIYTVDDTYQSEQFMALLTLQRDQTPRSCEVFWNNRRILTVKVTDFCDL